MRCFLLILLLFFIVKIQAQITFERLPYDYIWMLNNSYLNFSTTPVTVVPYASDYPLEGTNTSVCNEEGELLFYSNNLRIIGSNFEVVENGDSINFNDYWSFLNDELGEAYTGFQLNLALPLSPLKFALINIIQERYDIDNEVNYNLEGINMHLLESTTQTNNVNIIQKDISILEELLDKGKITTTRHSNGRDWWILVAKIDSNEFIRILITPQENHILPSQFVGASTPSGLGQAKFSPDGTTYARLNVVSLGEDQYIDIYQFDRCSGLLSDPVQFVYRDTAYRAGLAFSENSRFLYVSSFRYLYQFDLEAADIEASRKTVYQLTDEDIYAFTLAQLAPDGKIYIAASGEKDRLLVINNPNSIAPACSLDYGGFVLPAPSFRTLPNFPYYGLGPLDGSPCDTLGIDNPVPTAAFEYWQEEPASTAVAFFDASLFAYSWSWDFGDGSVGSALRHPIHSYAQPGAYEVCLTATNMTGSHTQCEVVMIGTVSSTEVMEEAVVLKAYPNPSRGQLMIELPVGQAGQVKLQDVTGKVWLSASVLSGQNTMQWNTQSLPSGLYMLLYLGEQEELLTSQRIIILK